MTAASNFAIASGMFGGFAVFAAGLVFFFLRAAHHLRAAWITATVVLVFFVLLGWALAVYVLPQLRAF